MASTGAVVPAAHGVSEGGRDFMWWGMAVFIASEAIFFATLISSYLFLRFSAPSWPPPGLPHLDLKVAGFNTVVLLASGIPQHFASQAIKEGRRRAHQIGTILAMILGAGFVAGTAYEYTHEGFYPQSSVYGSTFFVTTGFHATHVTVALIILLVTLIRSFRGHFSPEHHFGVEAATMYWHFVDTVWIAILITIYLL